MDGIVLDVTHKEFYLALLFFRNIGRPLSRAYIHEAVWIRETAVPSRTMDTHVSRVRNKLQLNQKMASAWCRSTATVTAWKSWGAEQTLGL
jgi:DNA-binding response OmpR family regulator